ncbi:MAG: peptidylprolyl isomerase [Gemmataceae bacterium]
MRTKLTEFLREPLVHFLAIGAGFFVFWHYVGSSLSAQPDRILITPGQVERLAQSWSKTRLRPPTAEELAALVEQEIDEEILYREAVALGLDRDDVVIRRRLAVKMEFLSDDLAAAANPTDEQLQSYLNEHVAKFSDEPLTTFVQVYVDRSKRGSGAAGEAQRLLALLSAKADVDWQALGDPFPLPREYKDAPQTDLTRDLGREFPKKLAALPVGGWSGPVESTYGLHLVLVRKRTAARTPPLKEVRKAVLHAWQAEQRQELSARFRAVRRGRYAVTVQWPDWAAEAAPHIGETKKGPR